MNPQPAGFQNNHQLAYSKHYNNSPLHCRDVCFTNDICQWLQLVNGDMFIASTKSICNYLRPLLFVCEQHNSKTYWWIFFKFSCIVYICLSKSWLNFGDANVTVAYFKATQQAQVQFLTSYIGHIFHDIKYLSFWYDLV